MATNEDERLEPYVPPTWATGLPIVPKWKVKLAMTPTPIHRWYLPGIPEDVEVYIKRDDMTGSVLSGNKIMAWRRLGDKPLSDPMMVRKLEFLLADALAQGCRHVITIGGIQSNHCRSTAIAAKQLGLKTHLLLRCPTEQPDSLGCQGNVFLNRLVNAELYACSWAKPPKDEVPLWFKALADKIQAETGETTYPILGGGSTEYSAYAYMDVFKELMEQDAMSRFDDVIVAAGSGGTAEGLSIGNHLSDAGLKIHGVNVFKDIHYIYENLSKKLRSFELTGVEAKDILDAIDGHIGQGYGQSTQKEIDFVLDVAAKTGIILDPVYTGKTAMGLVHELNHNRSRFKGNRILFIHTGGIFGMFDGRVNETLVENTNRKVKFWSSIDSLPVKFTP